MSTDITQIQSWFATFESEEYWKRKGWTMTETVDGKGLKSWEDVCGKLQGEGRGSFVKDGRLCYVLEVTDQELFQFNKDFLKKVAGVSYYDELYYEWSRRGNGKKCTKGVGVIEKEDLFCTEGRAFNFPVDHLCRYQLPNGFKLSSVAAMFGTSRWFTNGHVEICGDDSIACTLLGFKVFIYATSIRATKWLVNQTKDADAFRRFAERGPPAGDAESYRVCIPKKGSLVFQPSLFGHTVLTTKGPSLVAGWEAGVEGNQSTWDACSSSFGFGLGQSVQSYIRSLPPLEQQPVLPVVPGDVGELMRREAEANGGAVTKKKTVTPKGSKKRGAHLPNCKKSRERKQEAEKGKKCICVS